MQRALTMLAILLVCGVALGSGFQAEFLGSSLPKSDYSTIFMYDMTTDGSGNLIDVGGENQITKSSDFGTWSLGYSTVSADQYKSPVTGLKTADILVENGTAGQGHYVYKAVTVSASNVYTFSIYVKSLGRKWAYFGDGNGGSYAWFDLKAGKIGSSGGLAGTAQMWNRGDGWYRLAVRVTGVATAAILVGASNQDGQIAYDGASLNSLIISGAQVVDSTDGFIVGPGPLIETDSVAKPRLDLAYADAPTRLLAHMQRVDGNPLWAEGYGGANQYRYRNHDNCMDVWDQDHTFTILSMTNTTSAGEDTFFGLGAWNDSGVYFEAYVGGSQGYLISYNKSGGSVTRQIYTPYGYYHILQIVRSSNVVTLYADGVASEVLDVTGHGTDTTAQLRLGNYSGGGFPFDGSIAFVHLQSRAKSTRELAEDRDRIRGVLSSSKGGPAWSFSRATSRYTRLKGDKLVLTPAGVPRVGGQGAYIAEPLTTNLCPRSEDPGGYWSYGGATWTNTTSATLPNGAASGTMVLHEDGTAGFHYGYTPVISFTANTYYTATVFAMPINRTMFNLAPGGSATYQTDFDLANGKLLRKSVGVSYAWIEPYPGGFYRVGMTWQHPNTESLSMTTYLEDTPYNYVYTGGDQDAIMFWGAQVEARKWPTTYCGPTTASSLTCNGDALYAPAHTAGTTKDLLPDYICPTCPAKDITIQFDVLCSWDSPADPSPGLLFDINPGGDWVHNRMEIDVSSGNIYFLTNDNAGVEHYARWTAGFPTISNWQTWHTFKMYVDSRDFSRLKGYIDGVECTATGAGLTGSGTFDFRNAILYIQNRPDFSYQGGCQMKNFDISY